MATVDIQTPPSDNSPRSSSRLRRIVRGSAIGIVALVSLTLVGAILGAYAYSPSGVRNPKSPYLARVDSRFVDTDLARFHYIEAGEGPPVVLIHGGGEWAYSYRNSIDALARHHRVYAVDLPGHGYTTLHRNDFRFDVASMTDSIRTFLDALHLQRVDLVGHSWGGGWALRFAEIRSQRVEKLVLVDSSGLDAGDTWDWRSLEIPVVGDLMMNLMNRGSAKALMQKAFHTRERLTDADVDEYWGPDSQPTARTALLDLQRNQDWSITERDLGRVTSPTLVIWGSDDRFIPKPVGERLARSLNAPFVTLDGCGHSSLEECPDLGTRAVTTFLTAH